jgi:hypothetical protein
MRNLQAMNQALILMESWRIADQPNEFPHAILKSKYFPDSIHLAPKTKCSKISFMGLHHQDPTHS